jgi:hypothetical protein
MSSIKTTNINPSEALTAFSKKDHVSPSPIPFQKPNQPKALFIRVHLSIRGLKPPSNFRGFKPFKVMHTF